MKQKTSPWLILFRIVFTCCLVYSVFFIFSNSLEIAAISSDRSQQVRELINKVAGMVGLGPFSLYTIRKLAHFTEFMMMGCWFMLCLRVYTRHFIRHVSWPLFFGLGTAVTDETIQLFVEGRGSSVKDVWIDFSCFVAGLFVALFLLMFVRMCAILYKHRNDNQGPAVSAVAGLEQQPAPQPEPEVRKRWTSRQAELTDEPGRATQSSPAIKQQQEDDYETPLTY